jgi:RES domain-containing protein
LRYSISTAIRLCECFRLAPAAGSRPRRPVVAWRGRGAHIRAGETAALLVPSAAIRGEWNVLLNPAHPDFSKIKFMPPEGFRFDARMFR